MEYNNIATSLETPHVFKLGLYTLGSHGLASAHHAARNLFLWNSVKPRWGEVVHARVADEAPVGVLFDSAQRNVGRRWHVWHVEVHGDVCQSGPLHLMQGARVSHAQREVHHLFFWCPWMNGEATALVRFHDDVATVHAEDLSTHATATTVRMYIGLSGWTDQPRNCRRATNTGVLKPSEAGTEQRRRGPGHSIPVREGGQCYATNQRTKETGRGAATRIFLSMQTMFTTSRM